MPDQMRRNKNERMTDAISNEVDLCNSGIALFILILSSEYTLLKRPAASKDGIVLLAYLMCVDQRRQCHGDGSRSISHPGYSSTHLRKTVGRRT